jgi:hypothetical protein
MIFCNLLFILLLLLLFLLHHHHHILLFRKIDKKPVCKDFINFLMLLAQQVLKSSKSVRKKREALKLSKQNEIKTKSKILTSKR